ncbi:uncharacterized protein [Pyxicephalus adspersus]|uniref:Uncharacterized protein n=1 Tax=Pyxicephalus adspersus TaxID=30357 RepID=A0AAV3B043_PYXAD|nr:TPA: hypothetical protein GDO54_006779 [Pyxicephalus adspersus]
MKETSGKKKTKKKTDSAWVEVTRRRGMDKDGHGVREKKATRPPVTATSPVIPILCLPKVSRQRSSRAAGKGNSGFDDRDKGYMGPKKKNKKKKETQLLLTQDVKRSDQMRQCIERSNNNKHTAESGILNSNNNGQHDKVSVKKRQLLSTSRKKETKLLIKQDIKRNNQMLQCIERNDTDTLSVASGIQRSDIPGQHHKVSVKKRQHSSTIKKQKNEVIVMDLIKQNVLENERLRQKFQQHRNKD